MTGTCGKTRRLLINLSLLLFMACKPNCDPDPPTLMCDTVSVSIGPGTCVEIQNPCGNHQWARLDALRLCDAHSGVFIQTQRNPRARFLCLDSNAPTFIDEPVNYHYVTPGGDEGVGQFRLTTFATPLEVVATGNPTSIPVGGSTQLNAMTEGGTSPYSYAWTPIGGLSNPDIASPVASPSVTTQYTVIVTDGVGSTAGDSVVINVGLDAVATATPTSIAAGQTSMLNVAATGGTPPYTYSWQPAAGLNDPVAQSPIAMPSQTTEYTVTVVDAVGTTAFSQVTVTVNATLDACFVVTPTGSMTAQGDASCSVGPIVEYRWWYHYIGPGQPPHATTTAPFHTLLYEVPGEYTVRLEVADAIEHTRGDPHVDTAMTCCRK
jgi:hypothetical protein